jgi:hypothetical protein
LTTGGTTPYAKTFTATKKKSIMKLSIFIFFAITFLQTQGQEKFDFFFDEIAISVNRTNLENENTEDRYGFGIGINHSFRQEKSLNIMFGLEYNKTSQFKKNMYEGHYADATDLTYNINYISVPIGLRYNVGKKVKIFTEFGGYADLNINTNRQGTLHTYLPNDNNQIDYKEMPIDERISLANSYGIYVGIGIRIPIYNYELIIRPDFKYGINELYSYQDDIYNRYFRLSIGLKMN